MEHLQGFDRRQAALFPTAIDDIIPDDNGDRLMDGVAQQFGLEEMGNDTAPRETEAVL